MKKSFIIFLFLFCMVLPAASLAEEMSSSDVKVTPIEKTVVVEENKAAVEDSKDPLSKVTIKRFKKVDDVYHRGSKPNGEQYKELADIGIKTVIDLRLNNKKKVKELQELLQQYNMNYVSIPLNPMKAPTKEQIDKFYSIINNPEDTPVYVHCTHGQDRTGIMSAIYRVDKDNWAYDEAYAEMLSFGYHPRLYRSLKKFLKKYADEHQETLRKD